MAYRLANDGGSIRNYERDERLAWSEATFQREVIKLARAHGWLVHAQRPARTKRGWATAIQGDPGFPDLVLVRQRRIIFAELKTETGRLPGDQRAWLGALEACQRIIRDLDSTETSATGKGIGVVTKLRLPEVYQCRPGDWDEIVRLLA